MLGISPAQIHLAVNHLPVVGALLASGVLLLGAISKRRTLRSFGLALLVFATLSALPTYFSGEPTEERVEHRPGVSERVIERHEEAAGRALAAILVGGAIAVATLVAAGLKREKAASGLFAAAVVSSLTATVLLGQTAHLGGQIRHDEIRAAASERADAAPASDREGTRARAAHDDDDDDDDD